MPETWVNVRTRLIPKPIGGSRPISITAVCWRLTVGCFLEQYVRWVIEWVHSSLVGAILGFDFNDNVILHRFEQDLDDAVDDLTLAGASVDLSKFFDHVDLEVCLRALEYLGLCKKLANKMREFYARVTQWFGDDKTMHLDPIHRTKSILQECSMSYFHG